MQNAVFQPLGCGILTVSDSRTRATDRSGAYLETALEEAGHNVIERTLCPDCAETIEHHLKNWVQNAAIQVIVTTGGTGITERDVTPEALERVREKPIPGFGELFRFLSYKTIGSSAIQSRADGGLAGGTLIFCLPGSPGACRDGWTLLLKPQLDSRTRPCNFVELLPRLSSLSSRLPG